jgi:histidine triad (HIT) family protein
VSQSSIPPSGRTAPAGSPHVERSVFAKIISGDLPGRFVWNDERVVAFLTIAPIRPGHVLVVPVQQIDRWTEVPPRLWSELMDVSHVIGGAIEEAFDCERVGLMVAGLEVPHCHVHLLPIRSEADLDFQKADHSPDAAALDDAAERIRAALRAAGHSQVPES